MKQDSTCIVAVGISDDIGNTPDRSALELQAQAAQNALDEAGLKRGDIDGLITQTGGRMAPVTFAEYFGIQPRFVDATFVGGASNVMHLALADAAIRAGLCDTVLVSYGTTPRQGEYVALTPEYPDDFERPYGVCFPVGLYALCAQRHMFEYGTRQEQFAKLVVESRRWGALNPRASRRDPLTIGDVLASPPVISPIHRLDCCLVSDAGGAYIVTSLERARDLRQKPVALLGSGQAYTHRSLGQKHDITTSGAALSAPRALERAGLKLPDIDVFQIYDAFSSQLMIMLEDIGLCPKGEGGPYVESTDFGPGGDVALNTSGGGLSFLHPGMFGMFLVIEAVQQLRGDCGDRQVANASTALVQGNGGVLFSEATAILGAVR
ncbi:MAG: acetyl-CoA acetyltransferase [Hyphomicrobiales bacterium]